MQSEPNREKQQKSNEPTEAKKEFGIVIHNLDIFVGRKTSGIKFFGKCSGNQLIENVCGKISSYVLDVAYAQRGKILL